MALVKKSKSKTKTKSKKQKKVYTNHRIIVLLLLLIIASIFAGWSFLRLQTTVNKIKTDSINKTVTEEQSMQQYYNLIESVQKHIIVNSNEEPFVAIIGDGDVARKLQPFFNKAQTDDVIVMYSDKAILFRPSEDKIVNIGPVFAMNYTNTDSRTIEQNDTKITQEQVDIRKTITLDIRNGSSIPGRAAATAENLSQLDWYKPINIDNAKNYQYPQTLIINLGNVDVSELEDLYDIKALVDLPDGEVRSEADVVIILGNDNEK